MDTCSKAAAVLPTEARKQTDHRVLEPWVRSQLCLGNHDVAETAIAELARMGYRDASYLNYINNHNLKEKQ
jgi:hypothetical protein